MDRKLPPYRPWIERLEDRRLPSYMAADLGAAGLWRYSDADGGWKQVSGANPSDVAISVSGDLVANFAGGGGGVWFYLDDVWRLLTQSNPSHVAVDAVGDVVMDFDAGGVWRYTDGVGWDVLTYSNPTQIGLAADGTTYASFPGAGF